ncbi:MAG TPA: PorV/PorQ family protein [bacterium]|mgnify:CR=1 FL=1|nr:PorV/PorQ family protein [bacterium]HPQ19540.1 PorV/PorQ family protein [bacterium]
MSKKIFLFIIFGLITNFLFSGSAGTSSGLFLKIPAGSQAIGVGNAFTSKTSDINSIYWNPAGLSFQPRREIMFMHNSYLQDLNYEYLAYCEYIKAMRGAIGINAILLDVGAFDRTYILNTITEERAGGFSARDFAFGISYGSIIARNLALGGSLKYISSKIAEYNATTFALDLGMQYKITTIYPMKLGLALRNIGPGLKYQSERNKLPFLLKLGYNIDFDILKEFFIRPAIDFGISNSSDFQFNIGSEFVLFSNYFLRLGYDSLNDVGSGFTCGFGIKISDFAFDYAYVPFSDLGNSHNLTFKVSFGQQEIVEAKKTKLFHNILRKFPNKQILTQNLIITPIYSYATDNDIRNIQNKIGNRLYTELNKEMRNKLIKEQEVEEYYKLINEPIISEVLAMKLGLLSGAENILYSDIARITDDKYVIYYKVFNMTKKRNVLEARIEFNSSQIEEVVKTIVIEIQK